MRNALLIGLTASVLGAASPAFASDFRDPVLGEWRGRYVCAQGVTALSLTVTPGPLGTIEAVFAFGPVAENPELPQGAYRMHGFYLGPTRGVILKAQEWIEAPAGYMMVDMQGHVSRPGGRMSGAITEASCGPFELRRDFELIG